MKTKNHLHSLPLKKWKSSQWEVLIQNRPITPNWQRLRIPPLLLERLGVRQSAAGQPRHGKGESEES